MLSRTNLANSPINLYRYANSDARVDVQEQTTQVFTLARRAPSSVGDGEASWDCVAIASSRKKRKLSPNPLSRESSYGLQGRTKGERTGAGRRNRLDCARGKEAKGFGGEGVRKCLQSLKGRCVSSLLSGRWST